MTKFTSIEQAVKTLGAEKCLAALNAKLANEAYRKEYTSKRNAVLAKMKASPEYKVLMAKVK